MAHLDSQSSLASCLPAEAVPEPSSIVSDELSRIRSAVQALSPSDAAIGFEYDGRLRINIDVRSLEELARLETLLPSACDGLFFNIQRRLVEHHPFLHRLTATVAR